jgi:hypothetical protein
MKKVLLLALMVCFSQGIFSQYSLGLVSSNYSGLAGSLINPSSMANTRLSADINLFSAHGFVENNYLYFPSRQSSFIKLVNGAYDYHLFPKPYGTGNRSIYSYYNDKSLKNYFVNTRIMGPSVMVAIRDHIIGIRTGFRIMSSTRRLPYDIANFSYYGMDFRPQQNTYFVGDNYDMSAMAWWELSFSYATVFHRGKNNLLSAGVSVGPLFGHSGAYASGGDTRYIVYNERVLNVEQFSGEFGIAVPVDYNTNEFDIYHPIARGYGWGMDLGITWQYRERPYQKSTPRNCYKKRFEDYKFKLGVSLLDIGWVNFNKNAEKHVFENVHNNWILAEQLNFDNIQDEVNTVSELFYGDTNGSYRGNNFMIYLPATLGVQFDYHLIDRWYVNSMVIIPAVYASPMVERPFVVAVTPRYENRFLEINLPLVLYDFTNPRFGLSIRVDGFTIGTDNLKSFTSSKDFTGTDIYVSYRIMLRNDGKNPYTSKGACYNNWRSDVARAHKNVN